MVEIILWSDLEGEILYLRISVNDNSKLVVLWLNNGENNLVSNLPENIEKEIEEYKNKKYKVCIYQSGNDDIKANLLNLILNNA